MFFIETAELIKRMHGDFIHIHIVFVLLYVVWNTRYLPQNDRGNVSLYEVNIVGPHLNSFEHTISLDYPLQIVYALNVSIGIQLLST